MSGISTVKNENPMGSKPIFPLLITMALPPSISMLIQSLYNIIDSIYVAKLGENALTAVSLAYPIQNLVLSLAVGLGVGMNASIARNLGAKNQKEADSTIQHGLICAGVHSLLFVLIGLFLTVPFLRMFTQDTQVLSWGTIYCRIVICLSFGSIFHIAIEKIFQSVGNMFVPMILQAAGAFINIVLDPVFIFGYLGLPAMGVAGAAIATVIAQVSACLLSIIWLLRSHLPFHIHWKEFRFNWLKIKELYMVAVPSTVVMAIPSTLVGILNGLLISFSQTAVAVFGVYFKLQSFVYMPTSGLVQGMRPIVSYNYGAGNHKRMHETIKDAVLIASAIMLLGTLIFFLFAKGIMGIFSEDPFMIDMGVKALRIICLGFLLSSPAMIFAGALEALGKGFHSLSIVFLRQLVFVPVLAFLLSSIFGLIGIWAAFPIAEAFGAIIACIIGKKAVK